MIAATPPVGDLLRAWRQRRRLSQMDLASAADVSTRHVSFLETGRAKPSREMLLRLAEQMEIPLGERNVLLTAAGFAPVYPERRFDDPALRAAREAVGLVLTGHEPYPAVAVDRHWTLVSANRMVAPLLTGVDPALLEPPLNVLRVSLHPKGLAPRIANLARWRAHILDRLRRQVELTADPVLTELLAELRDYPAPDWAEQEEASLRRGDAGVVVPFRLRTERGILAFIGTTTVFGTPVDVTLEGLAIESFFPADRETAEALRGLFDELGSANLRS
jgi:transcriptional regulator with XRE-family HTH domain